MPGAYAHLTLVSDIQTLFGDLDEMPVSAKAALLDFTGYRDLGAVSPDYPYLAITDGGSAVWADNMHYIQTGQMIRAGTRIVADMPGAPQQKCLAWLLGYAAHVVMDVTIHPVVEMKVGPYDDNKMEHRICEMHQDAFIFDRLNLGGIGLAEYLDAGISRCSAPAEPERLDPDIHTLWQNMLEEVYQGMFQSNPPDIENWHHWFIRIVDDIASEGGRLLPLARHVAKNAGVVYPSREEVDDQYIVDLETPEGPLDYNDIFDRAKRNVGEAWTVISRAVINGDTDPMAMFGNWNLDTGRDQGTNERIYWG